MNSAGNNPRKPEQSNSDRVALTARVNGWMVLLTLFPISLCGGIYFASKESSLLLAFLYAVANPTAILLLSLWSIKYGSRRK